MYSIKNELLNIGIKAKGAELSQITSAKHQTEFMWQADPKFWGSSAPNLFPIIGCMKEDFYTYEGQTYKMPKHGFARHNENFTVSNQTDSSITFVLTSDETLYALYPFKFELHITYTLTENTLSVHHKVKNLDIKPLYFSLGGHPAFNCPINADEEYNDYFLEFEKPEESPSYLLNMSSGLLTEHTKPVFTEGNIIKLRPDLFDEDALIFKSLNSRVINLKHKSEGLLLKVNFEDFKQLGIWAKPNAPYVCIEPWLGYADLETTDQNIKTKDGILELEAASTFSAAYHISIEKNRLV